MRLKVLGAYGASDAEHNLTGYLIDDWFAVDAGTLTSKLSLAQQVEAFERAVIERTLAEAGGRISTVMERLDVPRRTLSEKTARLGLDRRRFAEGGGPNSADDPELNGGNPPTP